MARQLLPGEIPPQEPIRFKTEATEHTGSVIVERAWPAGLGHPDDRNCGAGEEFVRAHVRSGGVHIRAHCRR